jgi:hypothetical protein
MISSVSQNASASAVNVDTILAILNFQLIPSLVAINANPMNGPFSIFEPSVAKHLLVLIFYMESFKSSIASIVSMSKHLNEKTVLDILNV